MKCIEFTLYNYKKYASNPLENTVIPWTPGKNSEFARRHSVFFLHFYNNLFTNPYVAYLLLLSSIWKSRIQTGDKHFINAFCLKAKLNTIHGRPGVGGGLLSGNRKYLVILYYTLVNFFLQAPVLKVRVALQNDKRIFQYC